MAYEVKKVTLFETHVDDAVGVLGVALTPLATAKVGVDFVLGYTMEGKGSISVGLLEVDAPTKKVLTAAGFKAAPGAALFVACPNKVGGGATIATAIAATGVSIDWITATVVGSKAGVVVGFAAAKDATKVKKALEAPAPAKKPAAK